MNIIRISREEDIRQNGLVVRPSPSTEVEFSGKTHLEVKKLRWAWIDALREEDLRQKFVGPDGSPITPAIHYIPLRYSE